MPPDQRPPPARALKLLAAGAVEILGRMPWSSNGTFLAQVTSEESSTMAIYKPGRAERPLWDFPDGLWRREVAAFVLARALGWEMVPETVTRGDAPLGVGSLQRFVDADFEHHYFTLLEDPVHHRDLRRMAAFDVVANNADRKGGHCLVDAEGRIWGIDHGLCFHDQPKLRTVIWDFAGEPIPADLVEDLRRLASSDLDAEFADLLHDDELGAMRRRIDRLISRPYFPQPRTDHPYPWPLV